MARGAELGDRLCVFDPTYNQFGCETIVIGDDVLSLRQDDDWQVDVAVTAGAEPIYVAKPMLLKDPLWSQSQFEKLQEPLDQRDVFNEDLK